MMIPTPTVSAGQTLVQDAFSSQTLSGLGQSCGDCQQYDDNGNCLSIDTVDCTSAQLASFNSGNPTVNSIDLTNLVPGQVPGQGGSAANQSTVVLPSGTTTATTTSTGMTTGNLALLNTIAANAGTIGKELAISPGTTVSASGAVSQQNPGFAIPGTSVSASLAGSSSTLLLLAAVVAVAFMMSKH